jgi:hypothetical protein
MFIISFNAENTNYELIFHNTSLTWMNSTTLWTPECHRSIQFWLQLTEVNTEPLEQVLIPDYSSILEWKAVNWGFLLPVLGSDNLLEYLTQPEKTFSYKLIVKDKRSTKEVRARILKKLSYRHFWSGGFRVCHHYDAWLWSPVQRLPKPCYLGVFIEVYHIGIADYLFRLQSLSSLLS